MAVFDLQIKVERFLAAQLVRLQSKKVCPPPPWTVGPVPLRVQRIEFGANAIRRGPPGQTRIAQEVVVQVASVDDVLGHPDGPPALELPFRYRVLLDLDYVIGRQGCELQMRYADTEPISAPALPAGVSSATIDAIARDAFARVLEPIAWPLGFANLLPGSAEDEVTKAGLTVSSDLALLVIRAQTGRTAGDLAAWDRFFAGAVSDGLGGADWGMFIESTTLQAMVVERVRRVAAQHEGISVQDSWYSATPGMAHVGVKIAFDKELLIVIDVHDHEIVRADLSVTQPGRLTTDVHLPDVVAVADMLLSAIRSTAAALLRLLAGFTEAMADAAVADISLPAISAGPDCTPITIVHQRCTQELAIPRVDGLHMRLTGLQALADRVGLTGELQAVPLTPSVLTSSVGETRWVAPEISCGSADLALVALYTDHAEEMTPLRAEVVLDHSGTTPVYICDVEVRDPLGRIPPGAARWDGNTPLPAKIVLEVPNPGPEYADPDYHVDLLVTTTLGARLVRLESALALTEAIITHNAALMLAATAACEQLVARPIFELIWLVNPPFDREAVHQWHVAVEGLTAQDSLQLIGPAGEPLVSAHPLPDVVTNLSALVASGGEGPELTLVRQRAGDVGPETPELGVEIRQQLVSVAATIPLEAPCRRVFASQLWARKGVVAVLDDVLVAFDLAMPARPRRIGRWPIEGLRGARPWRDGLLVCHRDGFAFVGADRGMTAAGPRREPSPLLDATVDRETVHVLTSTAIETRSADLTVRSQVDAEGARCLLRVGRHLVAGGDQPGIAVHRLGPDGTVTSVERSLPDIEVAVLELASGDADGGTVLATLTNGSAWLFVFDAHDRGRMIASYPEVPWFAGSTRTESAVVRVSPDRRWLEVSTLGESRRVGAEASRPRS